MLWAFLPKQLCNYRMLPKFIGIWQNVLLTALTITTTTRCTIFIYFIFIVEKVHIKETKQMTLQLDRKVHDSNTCPTLKHKNTLKNKNTNIQKHE